MQTADAATVSKWLDAMAAELSSLLQLSAGNTDASEIAMIGVQSGGVCIAELLHQKLALDLPLGSLNIAFYRDDFSRIGLHPAVTPSALPFSVENRTIVLVDDVLYSGRTVRAALNEIFDYGRPARVVLAVLVERDGRELPICADVKGQTIALQVSEQVKLNPVNMTLEVHTARSHALEEHA